MPWLLRSWCFMAKLILGFVTVLLPLSALSAESGMPQLDASTYLSQAFWLVICFGILFFVMTKVALPRVSEVLNLRDSKIRHDIEAAEKLKAEAEDIQAKINSNLAQARSDAADVLRRATEQAAEYAATATAKTDASINNTVSEALENIEQAKAKAVKDIDSAVVATARGIVKKLADLDVNESSVQKAAEQTH